MDIITPRPNWYGHCLQKQTLLVKLMQFMFSYVCQPVQPLASNVRSNKWNELIQPSVVYKCSALLIKAKIVGSAKQKNRKKTNLSVAVCTVQPCSSTKRCLCCSDFIIRPELFKHKQQTNKQTKRDLSLTICTAQLCSSNQSCWSITAHAENKQEEQTLRWLTFKQQTEGKKKPRPLKSITKHTVNKDTTQSPTRPHTYGQTQIAKESQIHG